MKNKNVLMDAQSALKKMMAAHKELMPGINHIACQDYENICNAPVDAAKAIEKIEMVLEGKAE